MLIQLRGRVFKMGYEFLHDCVTQVLLLPHLPVPNRMALTKAFLSSSMMPRNEGHIINISSTAGQEAYPGGVFREDFYLY